MENATPQTAPVVLRVSKTTVVGAWRERDRALRRSGADVALISARRWNEGGAVVQLEADEDDFVVAARTWGSHPNLFLYDPRPIWRSLRRRPPQILDVHEEPCSIAAAELRLLRRLACPSAALVLYSAQNIYKRYPWPFRALERAALRAASGAYVCNNQAVTILRRKGFTGTLAVLPLGVDLDRFIPAPRVGPDHRDGLRLGYVGRLEEHKGVQVLLKAMVDEPTWSLHITGEGPFTPNLKELVHSAGLEGRVRFGGYAKNVELPSIYQSFDILVVPSLSTQSWEEQFCRVAVEAMACAVPVVASASGALPEVVGDGGLLFPPGDHAILRQTLQELHRNQEARRELGERARLWSRRFSWNEVALGHRQLYDAILEPPS